jgi:two-component system cell cycle sensor histidine kinase/response regulator CckA
LNNDEEDIIDVGAELLETLGYKVITANNGEDAVKIYEENMGSIAILIIDMIMPRMNGGELYDTVKEMDHDAKVLLSSGYSIDGEASKVMERGCNGFIQKPFGIIELSQKIRGILDREVV